MRTRQTGGAQPTSYIPSATEWTDLRHSRSTLWLRDRDRKLHYDGKPCPLSPPCVCLFNSRMQHLLLAFVTACGACDADERALSNLMREHVRPLIPFVFGLAGVGRGKGQTMHLDRIILVDAPRSVVSAVAHGDLELPSIRARVALESQMDCHNGQCTYVGIARIQQSASADAVFHIIAPHLHALITRCCSGPDHSSTPFTAAEERVLNGLLACKRNKEIARALGKSEATVRNQLHVIFRKLGVTNRMAALASLERLRRARCRTTVGDSREAKGRRLMPVARAFDRTS